MNKYIEHIDVTKELLDSIEVGDLVKMNDWRRGMTVRGVSTSYFVVASRLFGEWLYGVCEKKPSQCQHNQMTRGMFHIGRDSWVFGFGDYAFDDPQWVEEYLASFESGESELSVRAAVPVCSIAVRKKEATDAER